MNMANPIMNSVLREVTHKHASEMNLSVNSKAWTWKWYAEKYRVSGSYLRRYCLRLIESDFEAKASPLADMDEYVAKRILRSVNAKETTWVHEAKKYGVSNNWLKKKVYGILSK